MLETIKPAEDGRGVILRLYESAGETAYGQKLELPRPGHVFLSSMDETETLDLLGQGKTVLLSMKPFEILTLRVIFEEKDMPKS